MSDPKLPSHRKDLLEEVQAKMEEAWHKVREEHPTADKEAFSLGIKAANLKGANQAAFLAGMDVVSKLYEDQSGSEES